MNANCCNCFAPPCAASEDNDCATSEDICPICLEPVAEAPLGRPRHAVTCGGGHFIHNACLEKMLISNVEALRARSALVLEAETASTDALATLEGRVRCPFPSCASGPYPDSLVAMHVADEAFQTYLLGRTMLPAARELATALERARRSMGTAEGGEDLQAAADEALTCELLKASFAGRARQCARCFLGPVDKGGCTDLESHHGESAGTGRIDNSCPRCGWFAPSWEMWPVWDGRSARESGSMRVVDAAEVWRRRDEEGFDRDGFDRDGFDRDGFDRDGFDRDGFDRDGFGFRAEPQPRANRFVGCATVAEERVVPTSDDPDEVLLHATEPQPRANRFVGCATVAEERALPTSDDPDEVLLHYRNRDATWFRCGPMEWHMYTTALPLLVNVWQTCECADPELYSKMAPRDGWHEPNPGLRFSTPQPEQILKWEDRQLLYVWRLAGTEERRLNVLVTGGHIDEVPYNLFGHDDRDHAAFVKHWERMLDQCYESYRNGRNEYQCRYRP